MIVLDIETSGLNFGKCGIWQIGAIDLESKEEFLEEGRIDDEDSVLDGSLKITGKGEEDLRDVFKKSQKELLESFFDWCLKVNAGNCICQNPQFDLGFIKIKSSKYGLKIPFHYRAFDLHSLVQMKYFQIKGEFLFKEKVSDMGLSNILEFCGMKDNREAHNALEDSKLTAECFNRLVYGKNIFPEYKEFKIPEYLIK